MPSKRMCVLLLLINIMSYKYVSDILGKQQWMEQSASIFSCTFCSGWGNQIINIADNHSAPQWTPALSTFFPHFICSHYQHLMHFFQPHSSTWIVRVIFDYPLILPNEYMKQEKWGSWGCSQVLDFRDWPENYAGKREVRRKTSEEHEL